MEANGAKKRPYTAAKKKAQEKWNATNLERLSLSFRRGHRAQWEAAAARQGTTLTQWVLAVLDAAAEQGQAGSFSSALEADADMGAGMSMSTDA